MYAVCTSLIFNGFSKFVLVCRIAGIRIFLNQTISTFVLVWDLCRFPVCDTYAVISTYALNPCVSELESDPLRRISSNIPGTRQSNQTGTFVYQFYSVIIKLVQICTCSVTFFFYVSSVLRIKYRTREMNAYHTCCNLL